MTGNRVEVAEPTEIAAVGEDGFAIELPYTVSQKDSSAGKPAAKQRRLRVRLTGTKAATWQLSDLQARAAMIELGLAHLLSMLREREPRDLEELLINSETFPGACPFDPGRPPNAFPQALEI